MNGTLFFIRIPTFFRASIFLKFSDFGPRSVLKLFLNSKGVGVTFPKGVTIPKNVSSIFHSLLIFYYIIKLSKSLCFVSIMQKCI